MSQLPASVVIGPYTYTVEADKDFTDSHNAWAYVRYGLQRISVDPSAKSDRLRVAVFHEALHAIHEMTNLTGEKWEEDQVTKAAPMSVQRPRNTPDLVAFLPAQDAP